LLSPFPSKKTWKGVISNLCFILIFQHHIHKKVLKSFFINLHPICLQLNFTPIVELNLVELEFNSTKSKFNSNWIAILFMPKLHIGMNYYFSFYKHLKKILVPQRYLFSPYFSNAFNLGEK